MSSFEQCNQLFRYNNDKYEETVLPDNYIIADSSCPVNWLNVYGFGYADSVHEIIAANHMDEFLKILFQEDDRKNKIIDMDDSFHLTINVLLFEGGEFLHDNIRLFYKDNVVWTIQEKPGDHFEQVREYIRENKGIIRRRNADYLIFKLLEAILDGYEEAYDSFHATVSKFDNIHKLKPNPEFVIEIEQLKQKLLIIKNSLMSLREMLAHLNNWEFEHFGAHYFGLLKERSQLLIEEIDMNLQFQESNLNLIFNLQSHRLNEIMNTLTVFSVIFIPLTFLTGLYGMNFTNMPELGWPYGYFILLGIMFVITIISLIIIKRKKWF
ncbi:MAG: magnesium and cobalt transport protein CorA [Crocinitomicaceae bacterium]|nr:magnesium and cobalt transport protein CorA [Crocinitomicaceae bacterium]